MAKESSSNHFGRQVAQMMPLMFREFAKRENNELTRGQISFPQMVALDYAVHHISVKMTELAHVLSIQMSSTTVLVDRLVKQNMLKRFRDEKDRRVVWVSITPKGRKVICQIMQQKSRSILEIFGVLNKNERKQYLALVSKVYNHLQKSHEAAQCR